jgi:hypothetical protein
MQKVGNAIEKTNEKNDSPNRDYSFGHFLFYLLYVAGTGRFGGHPFADENTVDRCPQRIDCADGVLVNRKSE